MYKNLHLTTLSLVVIFPYAPSSGFPPPIPLQVIIVQSLTTAFFAAANKKYRTAETTHLEKQEQIKWIEIPRNRNLPAVAITNHKRSLLTSF